MTDLANLVVRMQADNSEYIKKLDQATQKLSKFSKDQTSLLSDIDEKIKDVGKDILTAFAVDKIVEFSLGAIEAQAALANFSQIAGISVETLSGMSLAAAAAGVSQDELSLSLKKLNEAASAAAGDATSKAGIAFKLLGITVRDANGNIKDAGTLNNEVADAFSHSADGANKVAIAVALYGKAGQQMIPMLNGGSQAMKEMQQAAIESGAALSGPAAQAAEALEEKLRLLQAEVKGGLGNAIAAELIPLMTHMADAFGSAGAKGEAFAVIAQGIGSVFKLVATFGIEVTREFESLGSAIGGAAAAVDAAAHGRFAEAASILKEQSADAAATDAKYVAMQQALYKTAADTKIAQAERGAEGAAAAGTKNQLGSLTGGLKSAEADKELEKFSSSLKEQALAFGLGGEAAAKFKLQFGPLADALKIAGDAGHQAAAAALEYARALQFKVDTKTSNDLAKNLQEQVDKLDQSDAAAFKYKITTGELGDAFKRMGAAGTDAQAKLTKLNNELIDDRDKKAVQALTDELDKMNGKLQQAAANAFDLQNKALRQNLGASTDPQAKAGLAMLDLRKQQTVAEAAYDEQVEKADQIEKQLATTEAAINAARAAGNITELQQQKLLNDARLNEIAGLQTIYTAEKKIADDSGMPKLIEQTQAFATQITNLKTQTDLLEKQLRDNLEQSFANNFTDLMNGSESFRKAFLNMGKDIEKQIDSIVSKDLAQSVFGTGGPGGGAPSFLAGLLGGGAGSGSGGGFASLFGMLGFGGNNSPVIPGVVQNGGRGGGIGNLVDSMDGLAGGGNIPQGGFALVGEHGPEVAYAGTQDMHIQPMSSANKAISVNNHFTVQSQNGTISRQSQTQAAAEAARQLSIASRRNN